VHSGSEQGLDGLVSEDKAASPELVEDPGQGNLSAAQLENGGSGPDDRQFLVGLRSEAPKACSC